MSKLVLRGANAGDLKRKVAQELSAVMYRDIVEPYAAALLMVRDAIGELFGPLADLESEEAVLLRGPEPHHDAEAIIAALQNVRRHMGGDHEARL